MHRLRQLNKGIDAYAVPQEDPRVDELRKAVNNADWCNIFHQGQTRTLCSPSWSASETRCRNLQAVCLASGAKRVLEIGSFVGVSALAMAQVIPDNGHITSLEIDPFVVDFGLDIKSECEAFWKIDHIVGPAWLSLQSLIEQAQDADWEPFDLAVIDADKAGMMEYFQILSEIPGLMSHDYVICVDVTPFKGQLSTQVQSGKQDSWLINSGQSEIEELRTFVTSSVDFESSEDAGILQVCKKVSLAVANPFACFPNCYSAEPNNARWAAMQTADTVEELRRLVINTNWANLFADGCTKVLVAASWSATWERCEKLQDLCNSCGFKRVLEVGSFCGVASLAMAEALPEDGQVVSLELDPFLVDFGQEVKAKSKASGKIANVVGPAQESLKALAFGSENVQAVQEPFDLIVIDADKACMLDYFKLVWESSNLLAEDAVVCVDIAPFKCQLFVPYVKGKLDDWIVKSGQESIDSFLKYANSLPGADVTESGNLVIIQRS